MKVANFLLLGGFSLETEARGRQQDYQVHLLMSKKNY
jgi:hypothetical protein